MGHLELFVADPLASQAFYVDVLGFELITVQPGPFVWLACGDQEFLLRPGRNAPRATAYDEAAMAPVLYTNRLEEVAEELKGRGLVFGEPDGAPCCLTFADPDGNWFQLVDPGEEHG